MTEAIQTNPILNLPLVMLEHNARALNEKKNKEARNDDTYYGYAQDTLQEVSQNQRFKKEKLKKIKELFFDLYYV